MKYASAVLFCLIGLPLAAQNLVQFHSDYMKFEFIKAGADLNGDNEITAAEAASVTELYFNTTPNPNPTVSIGAIDLYLGFFQSSAYLPYEGCSIDGIVEGTNDDSHNHGIPDYDTPDPPPCFEWNFEGISDFTSLESFSLSILVCEQNTEIKNLSIPKSVKTLRINNSLAEPLVLNEGSALRYFYFAPNDDYSLVDLEHCTQLEEIAIYSESSDLVFPGENLLKRMIINAPVDLGSINLQFLEEARFYNSLNQVNFNELGSLKRLILNDIENESLSLSNSSLEELKIYDFGQELRVEHCSNLLKFESNRSKLTRLRNNPLLVEAKLQNFLYLDIDTLEISNCASLLDLEVERYYSAAENTIGIGLLKLLNNPALSRVKIRRALIDEIVLSGSPRIRHFEFDNFGSDTKINVDFAELTILEQVEIRGGEMDEVEVPHLVPLRNFILSGTQVNNEILLDTWVIRGLQLELASPTPVSLSPMVNPERIYLENAIVSGWDASQLDKLYFASIVNSELHEELNFNNCDSLRRIFLDNTNTKKVSFCNIRPNRLLSIQKDAYDGSLVEILAPFDSPNAFAHFCSKEVDLLLKDCDGNQVEDGFILADIEDAINASVKLYPNPTDEYLNIDAGQFGSEEISVYNIESQLLKHQVDFPNQIFMGDLAPGIYLVRLKSDQRIIMKKVIVE